MAESAKDKNPLMGQLERQLEMNAPADMLYDIFRNRCNLFRRLMPQVIENVEDVWLLTFVNVNCCGAWKFRVECNDETRSVTWTLLDGEAPEKLYKTLKVEGQLSQNDQGCKAKVKLTYEKKDITGPVPVTYMDIICDLLVAAANNLPKH